MAVRRMMLCSFDIYNWFISDAFQRPVNVRECFVSSCVCEKSNCHWTDTCVCTYWHFHAHVHSFRAREKCRKLFRVPTKQRYLHFYTLNWNVIRLMFVVLICLSHRGQIWWAQAKFSWLTCYFCHILIG